MKYLMFARIFNELRLKAGFESLAEFGKALAQEGYIYEDSTFSRWKAGTRVPRHPRVLAAVVKIFVERDAIENKEEIIKLYEAIGLTPPAYVLEQHQNESTQDRIEIAKYLMLHILGEAFVKLHTQYLKEYYVIAEYDLEKYIILLRNIQQNPQHFIDRIRKLPMLSKESSILYVGYIKNNALVSKSDNIVMGKDISSAVMLLHGYTHRTTYG